MSDDERSHQREQAEAADRGGLRTSRKESARRKRHADEDELEQALGELRPTPVAARYLQRRVLPYARFCEDQANNSRLWYYWLRIPAIVLAAIVPALVAANLGSVTRWLATGLGIVVAGTTGVEHFLNVGARWRHYRSTVESLKSEAWSYLELAGAYRRVAPGDGALALLVDRTEHTLRLDWTTYVALVDPDLQDGGRRGSPPAGSDGDHAATGAPTANDQTAGD